MKRNNFAKLLVIAALLMILRAAPGTTRSQSPAPQAVQPSASTGTQGDPYTAAFAGLTYTAEQKEAISKIGQDIESRKAAIRKDAKLTDDQKNAMLTGYTRIQYGLIFKELTPEQKKLVSTRMHALHPSGQTAEKTQAPAR